MHDTYRMIMERPGRRATPDHLLNVELEKTHIEGEVQHKSELLFSVEHKWRWTEEHPECCELPLSPKIDRKTPLKFNKTSTLATLAINPVPVTEVFQICD